MPLIEIGRYNGALEVDMDIWSHLDDIVELDLYDLFPFKEAQVKRKASKHWGVL